MLTNCYFIHFSLDYGPCLQEAIFTIPFEMLTTLRAEIIGNLCSKSRKCHFWRPKIKKFSGGGCTYTTLVKSTSRAWLSINIYWSNIHLEPLHAKRLATPLQKHRKVAHFNLRINSSSYLIIIVFSMGVTPANSPIQEWCTMPCCRGVKSCV